MKNNQVLLILILLCLPSVNAGDDMLSLEWRHGLSGTASHVGMFTDEGGNRGVACGVSLFTTAGTAGWLDAFDVDGNLLWEKRGFQSIRVMEIADLDRDGGDEIIFSALQYVHCFSAEGKEKWKVATGAGNTITSIEIADINRDGFDEVIVGGDSTHFPNIHVIDRNGKILWHARAADGVNSIAVGDITGDGYPEVVVGTVGKYGVYYKSSYVSAFNKNGKNLWNKRTQRGIAKVYLGDIDNDGKPEVLLGSLNYLWVLDSEGKQIMEYETKARILNIVVEDIDLDGVNDIIVGSNDLYVLNPDGSSRLKQKWVNSVGADTVYDLGLMDVDSDGYPEILVVSNALYIVDYHGDKVWEYPMNKSTNDLFVGDLDGDSFPEVLVGSMNRNVYVFTTTLYQMRKEAEGYHSKAKNFYTSGNSEEAMANALKARQYYSGLNDNDKVSDMNSLISLINSMSKKHDAEENLAYSYYNKSSGFYLDGDYINASYWARKAGYKYHELHNETMEAKSDELLNNSHRYLVREAAELLSKALINSNESDYINALLNAGGSFKRYVYLEDRNKTIEVLELSAGVYTLLAERQRSSGDFSNASISAQKALFTYNCIEKSHHLLPPSSCFPDNAPIGEIDVFAGEIRDVTYNNSRYVNKSLYIKSLVVAISMNNSGSFMDNLNLPFDDLGSILNPVTGFAGYVINLVSWNYQSILFIIGLLFIIILLLVLLSMLGGGGISLPSIVKKPGRGRQKTNVSGTEYMQEAAGGIYEEPRETGFGVGEVEKVRRNKARGVGATLKSLRGK